MKLQNENIWRDNMKYIQKGKPINWNSIMVFIFYLGYSRKSVQRCTLQQSICCSEACHQWRLHGDICQRSESLSHVRHQNPVALLGYCESEAECFLVYDLCHNGNLSEWLFGIFLPSLLFIHSKYPKASFSVKSSWTQN